MKAVALGARAVMIGRAHLFGHSSVKELSPDDVLVPSGFSREPGGASA